MKYTLNINRYLSTCYNLKAESMYIKGYMRLLKYTPYFSHNEDVSVFEFQFASTIHDDISISDL